MFPASSDVQINAEAFLDRISNASLAGLSSRESETMEWLRKYVREVEDGIKGNYFITVKNKFRTRSVQFNVQFVPVS